MDSLYVCQFSNGHIKVGRSNDPEARLRQHERRVGCLGVTLDASYTIECGGSALLAEGALIDQCVQKAEQRHHNEWFTGLHFAEVCRWASECAASAPPPHVDTHIDENRPKWPNVLRALKLAGYTQMQLAGLCGCSQTSISDLSSGTTRDPSWDIGSKLIELAQAAQGGGVSADPVVASSVLHAPDGHFFDQNGQP